jgi:hypothetical protein
MQRTALPVGARLVIWDRLNRSSESGFGSGELSSNGRRGSDVAAPRSCHTPRSFERDVITLNLFSPVPCSDRPDMDVVGRGAMTLNRDQLIKLLNLRGANTTQKPSTAIRRENDV